MTNCSCKVGKSLGKLPVLYLIFANINVNPSVLWLYTGADLQSIEYQYDHTLLHI